MKGRLTYDKYYFCRYCDIKLPKSEAKIDKAGTPRCPNCSNVVRTKARGKKHD